MTNYQKHSAMRETKNSTKQKQFSPTMNRLQQQQQQQQQCPRTTTTVNEDNTTLEVPDVVFKQGSPLARPRANRRRSTLHSILERSKRHQKQQNSPTLSGPSPKVRSLTTSPVPAPIPSFPSYEPTVSTASGMLSPGRQVHRAELQFRHPGASPPQPQPQTTNQSAAQFVVEKKTSRSSMMKRKTEQSLRMLSESSSLSPRKSNRNRDDMEMGSATPSSSMDKLLPSLPSSMKQSGRYPYRVERSYRVMVDQPMDNGHENDMDNVSKISDKDAESTPSSSPLSAVFTLQPAIQAPPPQRDDLPPLPPQLQKQLKKIPRLSPPRKLPLPAVASSTSINSKVDPSSASLKLGFGETGLVHSPISGKPQSGNRRVISGSSLIQSPSKASFTDTQPSQNMHVLGPSPPVSAKGGHKGQAAEVFRRVGYWLYSTAPVQFIKQAMVEERNDHVNVLFSTEKSIWILGVSYRLKKNSKNVALPSGIEADSTHLQLDSDLFLNHHHQKRSTSPGRSSSSHNNTHHQRGSKQDANGSGNSSQKRSPDESNPSGGNRRRANTSGAMMNKKKLQSIVQLQNYPGLPPLPSDLHNNPAAHHCTVAATGLASTKHGLRTLASIPSQDILHPMAIGPTPISPMPFPDEPAIPEIGGRLGHHDEIDTDVDVTAENSDIGGNNIVVSGKGVRPNHLQHQHQQLTEQRPKSSKMNRLRSWMARTAKPMRRRSDVVAPDNFSSPAITNSTALGDNGSILSSLAGTGGPPSINGGGGGTVSVRNSRPASPQPPSSRVSTEGRIMRNTSSISAVSSSGNSMDPRGLGITGPATRLRRKSKETITTVSGTYNLMDGKRRSWLEQETGQLPPVPSIPVDGAMRNGSKPQSVASAAIQRRPRSSHSNAPSQRRLVSSHSNTGASGNGLVFGPNRREGIVRALISEFATWESPAASIMMFQREWKLPSFQQLVTIQSATAWAKECGWTVTLSSETFFMAYIFYNLPRDIPSHSHALSPGEKIVGDRLLLRMRLAMEDFEGKVVAGEAWRDALTAIILTIDARVAPKCPAAAIPKRDFSSTSLDGGAVSGNEGTSQQQRGQSPPPPSVASSSDKLTPEDHIKRMKMLEKHLAKVTESFAHHFWPRQEDLQSMFNTYPRCRSGENSANSGSGASNNIKTIVPIPPDRKYGIRRPRGWNMIPTLLTFKSAESPSIDNSHHSTGAVPIPVPDSPTHSNYSRKRHLYPMGLSINGSPENESHLLASRRQSPVGSVDESQEDSRSRPPSPSRSPVLSTRTISAVAANNENNRDSVYSQQSGGSGSVRGGRPASPVYKRATLGLYSSNNDVSTLTEDFSQTLGISNNSSSQRPSRLSAASSQSSGCSSRFSSGGHKSHTSNMKQKQHHQRKRKADEAGVVGKTTGGFEVVWSARDAMSTSYVMVPVPKTKSPESPSKMYKHDDQEAEDVDSHQQLLPHTRYNASVEADSSVGSHSQPNLKRVLESITREINLDSSYVLLLPPPPPLAMDADQELEDEDDEFGYLATTLLRRAKSEIVMRRTLKEFEHEYGLDSIDLDASDSDSFQLIDASDDDDGNSSHNSVYFSAEDDTPGILEHETWFKRLSGGASTSHNHHQLSSAGQRYWQNSFSSTVVQHQALYTEHDMIPYKAKPLSLNQLTLLEFFLDGMRRFYFTYRKGFPTITPSFYTSDMGWGCTYRTCQMMLAESFSRVLLSRFWDPFRLSPMERTRHTRIIDWFHDADAPKAYYSIHRMARTATEMDKRIGDWLGPSIAAHVMKRLCNKHVGCPLSIHVAIDQTVYASEVRKQALAPMSGDDDDDDDDSKDGKLKKKMAWRPLLLLVPVRLGLSRLNQGYIPKIKTLFQIPQSVGLVGGKPSRSFYFIGRQGDNLFYLDPHVTRQHVPRPGSNPQPMAGGNGVGVGTGSDSDESEFEMFDIPEVDEYHTTHICSMPIQRLDPSMLLGFLFNTEAEWDSFVMAATDKESQRSICTGTSPLFTLLSGSSMMTPQFDTFVQHPIPGHITKVAAMPEDQLRGGNQQQQQQQQARISSDSQVKSPRLTASSATEETFGTKATEGGPAPPPPLPRGRSVSSPRFSVTEQAEKATTDQEDEFEML